MRARRVKRVGLDCNAGHVSALIQRQQEIRPDSFWKRTETSLGSCETVAETQVD